WRVDGLGLHDIGPEAVDEITDAVAGCHRVIDRRPDRWYAGPCTAGADEGQGGTDPYALRSGGTVACRRGEAVYDVADRRKWLLEEAEDRLAHATEIARAVSWLGATPLTPDRVRQWAARERLTAKAHDSRGRALYRIGDAIDLLAADTVARGA